MYKCEICNKEFEKKMAYAGHKAWHVNRNGLDQLAAIERGKIIKQQNIEKYLENPKKCKHCDVIIDYQKYLQKAADERNNIKKGILTYNFFCSSSCAATYNNTHKTKGYRKSKLEVYLEKVLTNLYPNIEMHFNRKDAINSELDIYIPSLKLAFELNGIFHYEPIYGPEKLSQIKNNDERKFQACLENGIELCIIDSSKLKSFKDSNAKPYLDIICNIINKKNNI
jgi:hypothetical protein